MDKNNNTVTIDGKTIAAEPGKTVLQLASELGIEIPTLCYNQKVSPTTSCFVCVVKDMKTGKFMPSCTAVPAPGAEIDASSDEVRDMRMTALNLLLSEHSGDCVAPCQVACPAHAQVEEYVRAGREGDFLTALKLIKERIPLPLSIGRICPRFCEKDCRKNISGKPVAINDFKRLAADLHYDEYMEELPEPTGHKVAVVGAGPAGLSVAYFLRRLGIIPTVYERMPKAGGMLRYGIPEYRLPKAVLDRELAHFDKMGIKFEYNRCLGKDLQLQELKDHYDAVAVTIGCWKPSSMRCEGEEFAVQGIQWLEEIARNGWQGENPGKTIVIGGGNTAMDCLRTSVRLGSDDVTCFYRRTEKEMPADEIEVEEAREEGVKFEFLIAPVKLSKSENGKLVLTCQKMELGEPDASGRRRPVPVDGSDFDTEADTVIAAIGQKTDAPVGLKLNKWGDIEVDTETYKMVDHIFAAGDCVTGAATVVEGVSGGRRIALAIADYLTGSNLLAEAEEIMNVSRGHWQHLTNDEIVFLNKVSEAGRVKAKYIDTEERKSTFKEVTETIPRSEMEAEGKRCIECGCTAKGDCALRKYSHEYGANTEAIKGEKVMAGYDNRHPEIIHDRMKCIKCGICIKVCDEVVNQNLLSLKGRGFTAEVGTAFNQGLPVTCKECGACIVECPVGALAFKNKLNKQDKK